MAVGALVCFWVVGVNPASNTADNIAGSIFDPSLYLPVATYITFIALTPLFISKNLAHYPALVFILPTMHFSWGLGFLTSPRKLVPDSLR